MLRPTEKESAIFYQAYINLVPDGEIWDTLDWLLGNTQKFIRKIPEKLGDHRYDEGKWSVKEVLLHIIDTERVMSYRAMSIARGEKQSLLGFDENAYAPNSLAERRTIRDIADEHQAVRQASIHLFKHFPLETLNKIGVANKSNVSVRALGFIIAGHEMHHLETLKERYF